MIAVNFPTLLVSVLTALHRFSRTTAVRLALLAAVLLPALAVAAPVINTPSTTFTAAQSGRTFMTVGGVWNGTAEVTNTTGDSFSVTFTNSGDATAFDFAPRIVLPTGFTRVGTLGVSATSGSPVVSGSPATTGTISVNLGGYDLPAGASITLTYGLKTATTVASGTYQIAYNRNYSLTNGGALVGFGTDAQQNVLVQAGDTTINATPKQQIKAVGENANFTITVTNTGLGGLFDVTINESSIYPTGSNLQFVSLTKTAPALAATPSNGGSILTLPYLAPGESFTADVVATVLSCGSIVNTVTSVHRANSTPVSDAAPVQLNLLQPLIAYTPANATLNYNTPVNVSYPINNTGFGSAYNFQLQTTLNSISGLTVSNVAAGWSYNSSTGLFTYTANGGTIANGTSVTLSYDLSLTPATVCSSTGAGTVNYVALYANGCGDTYTIPLKTSSITAANNSPGLSLTNTITSPADPSRIAITESGTYTLTLSASNIVNIADANIVVTDTLPAAVTYLGNTPSVGTVNVVGQVVTWTVPTASLTAARTLTIDFAVANVPCNAGTQPTATANTSATSVLGCPLSASAGVSFLASNNPGLAASQYFNVTAAPNGFYETGTATVDLVRDATEGEFIPFEASYTFGPAYPGTWAGSTYDDAFGGVTGMVLVPGTLTVTGTFGTVAVPTGAITTLTPGFRIDLGFLAGPGFFNDANVAGHTVTFNYKTTAPDSVLGGGSRRSVTQLTNFILAGAGTGTSGGCNTPTQSTFTQGAFYTLGRATASVGIGMAGALEVCKEETLTLTVTPSNDPRNILVTLNNGAAFTYNPAQTPVYGGAFTAGNITYNANGGTSPTFQYTGNPLTAAGTIQVKVTRKANGNTALTGFSAKVDYDSRETQPAAARVYSGTASYAPSSLYKATLALNVTPGSITVTGPTVTYVTYVTNTDAGKAYGSTLTNTLPVGITVNSALTNAANPSYSVSTSSGPGGRQTLTWALGDIASGQTIPITLVADVGIIPGCAITINPSFDVITATWGCDSSIYSTLTRTSPNYTFPSGKMQVVHDSTQTVARLCDLGKIVVVVKNTGPTNIQGVIVSDVVPPSAGLSISGTVQYRVNGGSLQNALSAPTGDGSSGNPYVWTSTQIPELAQLVPVGVTGTNQINIEFGLAATETLAGQNPVLSASATATISCGNAVTSPAQPFTIPVERPSITVVKTGRNITANAVAAFTSTVYGGYTDDVEWKIVITNNGTATASNVRLSDPLSGSGGAAVINGTGLAANTPFTSGQIIALPDIAANSSVTYTISETLGNNCLTASRTADVTWGCTNNGATVRSNVTTPGSPTSAATIAMNPVIVSGSELTQSFTYLNGGRAKVTITFTNAGGTAYAPVVTATIPAGSTLDTTGAVTFTSGNASITGVTTTGTATSPIFTFTGPGSPLLVRYGETVTVSYYVRPTVFDTTNATTFPNLASPESTGNGLDPSVPAAANITAQLDYTTSCGSAQSSTNNTSYDPRTPDLDINLTYPGDVLLTDTSAANYVFTITNNGDSGSVADFINLDLPGLGAGWTVNSITLTTAGTGGTTNATITSGGAFTPAQVGTLAQGASAVVTVNAQYSGTPGPLTLVLRARGEARGQDGTTGYGDYSLDRGGRRVVGVILSKALQSTSETTTTNSNVLIGEEATFRISASFFGIEGDLTNVVVRDTPANVSASPTGLAYVSHVNTGTEITPSAVTVGGAAPAPVAAPASSSASRIDFSLPDLTVASVNGGADLFQSDVTVRVLNIAGNTDNATLTNNLGVSFTYLGQSFASSNANDVLSGTVTNANLHKQATLSVRRPAPVVAKTVRNVTRAGTFAASATGEAGDVVEYKVVITNPVGAERPLYDLAVSDTVPAKVNLSASNAGADTDGTLTTIEVANTAGTSGLGATLVFNQANTALPTAGSNFTRLDAGQTITLLFRGTLDTTVIPNETLSNTASLLGYSLTLPSGNQTAPLGTENTATGPTRYSLTTSAATVVIDNIVQTKSLNATSEPGSTGSTVFVGEQIRYRVLLQLPQGTVPNLQVTDQLPSGLSLVSTPVVTFGAGISPSTQPAILPVSLPANGSPLNISWDFGSRVASGSTASDRTVTIDYVAQVRNVAANVAGTSIVNNATYSYSGAPVNLNQVTVTVAAPNVSVTHDVRNVTRAGSFAATATGDAGDVIEYRVTVTNPTGANVSPAYDLAFADTLPAGLTYVASSTTATVTTGLTGTLGEPDVSGQSLKWGRTQSSPVNLDLATGTNNFVFTYRATIDDSSKPLQVYTNALVADWTSIDGAPGADLGVALDTPGNTLGERIGTGASLPNNLYTTKAVTVTALNSTTVTKIKSNDTLPRTAADALGASPSGFRVGDLVTYTVTIPVQEGTLAAFNLKDTLPTGMAFVATTSITPASNGGVPTPTEPFNYTTPTGPTAGATGALTWNFGTLVNTGDNAANDTLTVVYTARAVATAAPTGIAVTPTDQTLSNTATATYQKFDTTTHTTAASVAAIIARQPQLSLAKVVASPSAQTINGVSGLYLRRPGDTASFTLTVTNTGTAPAYNVKLTDTLPAGMRATAPVLTAATRNGVDVLATQTAPTWDNATGKFVFDLADGELLLPTQTLVLTYTVTIDTDNALKGTTLTNSATINQFFSLPSAHPEAASRRTYAAVGPQTRSIIIGLRIDGSVYHDLEPNNAKDVGEDWTGATKPTVYANLIAPNNTVVRTVTVAPGTGAFAFDYLPAGSYTVVVTNSAAGLTASRPANWLFQFPTTGSIAETINSGTGDLSNQDLGLNQGSYAAPIIAKSKSGDTLPTAAPASGFRIGDLVTYTVDINPQEGALTSFTVTDVLPAGLAFDTTTAPTYAQVTGTARYTFTAPVVGSTAPANGATGTLTWTFGNFTNAISGPVTNSTPSAIATNNTLRITYRARVRDNATGTSPAVVPITVPSVSPAATSTLGLTNSAQVGYTNPAPISAAASAGPVTASVDVYQPRLTIAKSRTSPTPLDRVVPGGTANYQITVTNDGTAPAYNTLITDTLPSGMRGATPSGLSATLNGSAATLTPVWTSGTGTYVFTLSDAQLIQPGQSLVINYTATVDAAATRGATLTNTAAITEFYSKASSDTTQRRKYTPGLSASADVVVGISISGFVYSDLQPNNVKDGLEDWSGVTKPTVYVNLLDNLGAVYASATVAPGTGAFSFTNLPAGTYSLVATDSATNTVAERPLNWPFQSPSNGTRTALTLTNADLTAQNFGFYQGSLANPIITKSAATGTLPLSGPTNGFRIGDLVTYTVDIQPQEGALTAFQVTDTLPAGFAFVATTSIAQVSGTPRFTYTTPAGVDTPAAAATGAITWNFGNFTNAALGMADNTLRITYTARVVDSGGIATPAASPATTTATRINSAGVAYTKPAPDGGAKSAGPVTSTVTVEQPRLIIAKTRLLPVADNIVMPGGTAQFRVTVTNNGTGPAYNTVVTDTLPSGLRTATPVLNAATLNGVNVLVGITPTYNSGTGDWVVSLTDAQILLPSGQTLVLDYTVTVDAAATKGSVLTNSALVTSYASKASADTTERRVYGPTSPSTQSLIVGIQVDGSVYHQLIPNGVKDVGTEDWTSGTPVFVNLVTNNAVNYGGFSLGANQVLRSVSVPVGTGDFTFTNVPSGTYRIIVTNTALATSAVVPATWTFDTPSSGAITPLAVTNANIADQNLGLYQGRIVSGRVYNDDAPFGTRESETWAAGTPVVVNLVNIYGGTPVVYASQAVPAGAGTYSFTNVPPGSYRLVVAQAGQTTVTTANVPTNWVFVNPSDGTRDNLTLTTTDLTAQDFGLTPGRTVSGFVYNDTTPNSVKDAFEDWLTGTPVVVNLVNLSNGTVFASANVGLGSGAYSFANVPPGNFRIIITNAAGSTAVAAPASWLFRAPATGAISITIAGADFTNQNFGLFRGRTARGVVYRDTGTGGGTPNDGVRNGSEPGIGGVTVRLLSGSSVLLDTAFTDGAGNFLLRIPAETADGDTLIIEEVNPPAHLSTGGKAGSAGGAYVRTTDRITFSFPDDDVTGLEFGDVPANAFLTDGAQTIIPGATAFYRHTYTAGTGGTVTFTTDPTLKPNVPWTRVLIRDLNANGQADAGEPIIDGVALTVTAGQEIALILKDNSPSNAPNGATSLTVITAAFTYTNASPSLAVDSLLRQDLTTIGTANAAGLQLVKAVDKTIAAPGEVITYTITYKNAGAENLTDLFIDDRTPAYTVFVSASAGAFPNDLTAVNITAPAVDASGTLRWTFTGTLIPGASGTVTFQVKVE
jgi:uncharacterized repeat protein (TIGR01451 family)/fimbrial isopeptide formation D2 family protein